MSAVSDGQRFAVASRPNSIRMHIIDWVDFMLGGGRFVLFLNILLQHYQNHIFFSYHESAVSDGQRFAVASRPNSIRMHIIDWVDFMLGGGRFVLKSD